MKSLFDTVPAVDPRDLKRFDKKPKGVDVKDLKVLSRSVEPVFFMSDEELRSKQTGSSFVFDCECYSNLFYIAFKCLDSGKIVDFELSEKSTINTAKLIHVLSNFTIVSFNGIKYDIPLISLLLQGANCQLLKAGSDFIIKEGQSVMTFQEHFKVKVITPNHVDLIEVTPLEGSLKLYAGRLHCKRMQDLPIDPDQILSAEDIETIKRYCCNDLSNTELLLRELYPEIQLRSKMSNTYRVDLRSKSDAQIAETVICSEIQKSTGKFPKKASVDESSVLKYRLPSFVGFESNELRSVLDVVVNSEFRLDALGSPIMPDKLETLSVKLGTGTYKLGMGGLHSTEKQIAHVADENTIIADNDVESYYPRIILNQQLFPSHLGTAFLYVFDNTVQERISAKTNAKLFKKKDKELSQTYKVAADSLKITINGSFGKFGNKYSRLYAPDLMLQVTITGQLCLLMLIEQLVKIGIEVTSANTDGVVSKYPKSRHEEVRALIKKWEERTNFKTEETKYKATYSRDVNTYIAVKEEGGDPSSRFLDERLGCKTKGAYSERGSALNSILSKNPEHLICMDAVLEFIVNGTSFEKTIKECKDIRRFVCVKNVRGGAHKNGIYLGKVVRWYYAKGEFGFISYVLSGNKVANTDSAKPLMDLPDELPNDINYDWYINKALEILNDCGFYAKQKTQSLTLW